MGIRLVVGRLGHLSLQHGACSGDKAWKRTGYPKGAAGERGAAGRAVYHMSGLTTGTASQISSAVTATQADTADGHLSLAFNIACCP